jgi:hypothetical protein
MDNRMEIVTLLYALGAAIQDQDWNAAAAMHARLLDLHFPDESPQTDIVLWDDDAIVRMAERQPTQIIH